MDLCRRALDASIGQKRAAHLAHGPLAAEPCSVLERLSLPPLSQACISTGEKAQLGEIKVLPWANRFVCLLFVNRKLSLDS